MQGRNHASKRVRGFTLLEVVVSAFLIAIGIGVLVRLVSVGRFFLLRAENKSKAMSVALVKMEEYLAKSYTGLEKTTSPVSGTDTKNKVDWVVNIRKKYEGSSKVTGQIPIPYQLIEVNATYNETDAGGKTETRAVRLENIIPYPLLHSKTIEVIGDKTMRVPYKSYQKIPGLETSFNYEVPKNFLVIYNIAIRVDEPGNIQAHHTMHTACFLRFPNGELKGPLPIETGTPIISQPLINNAVGMTDRVYLVGPGYIDFPLPPLPTGQKYTVEIMWYKDTELADEGKVSLREANLTVIAMENAE
ncbi:MAG: type II secretion system protein [Candidatus Omnitrophota bacterium]|jgi:type II secretory pathway pseudopilin PulG